LSLQRPKIEKAVLSTKAFFKTKGLFNAALARPEKKSRRVLSTLDIREGTSSKVLEAKIHQIPF